MKSIALYYSKMPEPTTIEPMSCTPTSSASVKTNGDKLEDVRSEDRNSSEGADVELHINLWKVEERVCKPRYRFYMDFGIMFPKTYRRLYLFLPFEIREKYPTDLAKVLMTNQQTLGAVFNADVKLTSRANDNYCTVTVDEKNEFSIYHLGNSNFKKIAYCEDHEKGVYLKINVVNDPDNAEIKDKIYVRFRVSIAENDPFVKTEHISNDLLQAAFSKTDLFDIRVNEIRVLNSKVKETMTREGFQLCKFSKVHLFFMADSRETVYNGSSLNQDTRMLEKDQWEGYMPYTDLHGASFVAYHWKRRRKRLVDKNEYDIPPIETFSVYFSTIYPKIHFWRMVSYLIVVILLGWMGSMLTFHLSLLKFSYPLGFVKPTIIVGLLLLLSILIFRSRFGITWFKIYRKR